jgi:hypothetical protein
MHGVHIMKGGPDRKIRDEAGTEFTFEDHPMFGPSVLDRHGMPKARQPGERASFWRVYQWWCDQGRPVDSDGLCAWKAPTPPKMIHIGGNHYRLVFNSRETPKEHG